MRDSVIAAQGRTSLPPASPVQYFGIHWLEQENGEFISRYPFGLPLLLAGAWLLFGWQAAFYVNPLLATLTLLVLFLLCRAWVGEKLALAAAALYAVVPLANHHALHSDAHTAAAFFLIAGIWALDRWGRRGGAGLAIAAGLLLGYLPPELSHVLRAIGLDGDEAESSIRFSLGFGTSDADVEEAVGLIEETLARLSKIELGYCQA